MSAKVYMGKGAAQKLIQIFDTTDLPMTFARHLRNVITGSPLTAKEKHLGRVKAACVLHEAALWAGTFREVSGDDQLRALPFNQVAEHFAVRRILTGK